MTASPWTLLDYRRPGVTPGWDYAVYLYGHHLGDVRKHGPGWQARTPSGEIHGPVGNRRLAGYQLELAAEDEA